MPDGYAGVLDIANMIRGFVYDGPDGKMRLEFPATRTAKTVVARYTDGDPTAAELGVPAPRRLTRPFGIINAAEGVLEIIVEGNEVTERTEFSFVGSLSVALDPDPLIWVAFSKTLTLSFDSDASVAVADYSFYFGSGNANSTTVFTSPATAGSVDALSFLGELYDIKPNSANWRFHLHRTK